ncbi:MAG: bifunctional phosphopantothenoylcysteine decarboxylase/phosphopantothenate--cysteine ligase CoaBC [Leuconostoc sp.]|uniref:bifunctional phosphopantothenoylcysteine decarboxylase/phosphopantothenate--cysteine ligase CoaBC n=1 Tax=Leuconostoc sp. TaxID=1930076 RepID=UPI0039EAEADE
MFNEKNVLVVVTGSVAAYKAASFVRLLVKDGANVRVAMTQSAQEFITSKTLAILSGHDVLTDLFAGHTTEVVHIDWAKWAAFIFVVPATANMIGKLANGIADDAATATIMASAAQKIIAPAMNDVMLANPAVTRNLATLTSDGWLVIAPAEGFLAEGYAAKGRLPEPEAILSEAAVRLRAKTGQLHGKKVVITAGGTREALDPVRYLTNKSSGKMGYALAQAAAENGAEVTLITTTDRPTNYGVTKILVSSTQDMYDAVMAAFPTADIFIGAAAVSDFKPATLAQDKIKKQGDGGVTLHLVQNPDILKTVGHQKAPHQLVVGFAAETKEVIAYGQDKLKKKRADMLIANDVSSPSIGFSSDDNVITILTSDQPAETLPQADKLTLAREIMQRISTLKS